MAVIVARVSPIFDHLLIKSALNVPTKAKQIDMEFPFP